MTTSNTNNTIDQWLAYTASLGPTPPVKSIYYYQTHVCQWLFSSHNESSCNSYPTQLINTSPDLLGSTAYLISSLYIFDLYFKFKRQQRLSLFYGLSDLTHTAGLSTFQPINADCRCTRQLASSAHGAGIIPMVLISLSSGLVQLWAAYTTGI